jgi:two-component system chemotaxis sensor kinase CheA
MNIDREALLQEFAAEAEEQLDGIEQALIEAEVTPGDRRLFPELFRRAHTLKGNASVVGFNGIVESAHVVEDALERLVDGRLTPSPKLVSLLLEAVDELRRQVAAALAGGEDSGSSELGLVAFLSSKGSSKAPRSPRADAEAPHAGGRSRSLRVDVDKLDRMLNLMGEITVARGVSASLLESGAPLSDLRDAQRDVDGLLLDLQEQVTRVRMVPVGPVFRQHARTVRDLALAHGKQARLVTVGDEVEIDTAAIERIRDPLVHMIRNAIDHGIEAPDVRRAKGKDPVGTIALTARYDAGRVLVTLSDDGAGLDRDRIRAKAREHLPEAAVAALTEAELFKLIFEPGFTTAEKVTDLSGRGVGMDVVRRAIEALRGTIAIDSRPEEGTSVTLGLPLTLAIIEGFSVGVGDQTYVLPLESVVECVELPGEAAADHRPSGVLSLRGNPLPYLRLDHHFGLPASNGARQSVVVVRGEASVAGIAVDGLFGEGQTVIKPLPRSFRDVRGVSGAALLGNGRVALILDVPALLREAITQAGAAATAPESAA